MALSRSTAFEHVLCLNIFPSTVQFAVVHRASKKVIDIQEQSFTSFDKEGISAQLEHEYKEWEFDGFCATIGQSRNTLIPVELFNHSKSSDIFKLNFSEPHENLDYNRIPELGITNIYEVPLWLKSNLIRHYPRIKMVHPVTVLLKGIFDSPTFSPKMHLYVDEQSFYFFITEKSKLQYYNQFEYTNLADMVYHILFVLEQKEMDQKDLKLHVYGQDPKWETLTELQKFFANTIKIENNFEHFLSTKQLLCV